MGIKHPDEYGITNHNGNCIRCKKIMNPNRTMICKDCRKQKCAKCGKVVQVLRPDRKFCGSCLANRHLPGTANEAMIYAP